jgi:hypothetical protein
MTGHAAMSPAMAAMIAATLPPIIHQRALASCRCLIASCSLTHS